jgi:glucoamylase
MKINFYLSLFVASVLVTGCFKKSDDNQTLLTAPGVPGKPSTWSYSGKTGIGTSYETYTHDRYQDSGSSGTISKVWFSIAQGVLTETMYGLIHQAQLQEAQLFIQGNNFLDEEKKDTVSNISYLKTDSKGRPLSLAYKILNRDKENQYEIEKHIFTDPDSQALMMRVKIHAVQKINAYLFVNPAINNTGSNDSAVYANNSWTASEGDTSMTLVARGDVAGQSTGFEGVSDGITELKQTGKIQQHYTTTDNQKGNVAFTLELKTLAAGETAEWDFVLGFGKNPQQSLQIANDSLAKGYDKLLAAYNGDGDAIGWSDYLSSLNKLESLSNTATDEGKLLFTSAMVLKAQEDKTHAGAFIASLSNPWGDVKSAEKSATGYKAVWPRDFYQVAMAMLALGDTESPRVAFEYLQKVQAKSSTQAYQGTPGWFLQKTHVDGEIEWVGVQLDQTAMPIMLGWRLWKEKILSDAEIVDWYNTMLKPAADFLVRGGNIKLDWNNSTITPPYTQQERWEEQAGFSPSTTAAVIAGLISAADIAELAQDAEAANNFRSTADNYSNKIESLMFATQGSLGNGRYFLRINANQNPNDQGRLDDRNGQVIADESQVIDGGFLELVRYGVRSSQDNLIIETLNEYDDQSLADALRVKYEFSFPGIDGKFPGWRRYGLDGYGEDIETGLSYAAINDTNSTNQRGRVWPIFTGERGHYELELAKSKNQLNNLALRNTYVKAMELFANQGMMLPEQVWDGVGNNSIYSYQMGEGTNSATPLAWSHAEYIKLLRSITDGNTWDKNASTEKRYTK